MSIWAYFFERIGASDPAPKTKQGVKPKDKSKRKAVKAGAAGIGVGVAVVALALPIVAHFEGLRTEAYSDAVGVPTICFGETLGVSLGDTKTKAECDQMLEERLGGFLEDMRNCTDVDLPAKTEAAFLSFTYNLGIGTYCRNIAGKRINAGNVRGACEALLLYNKAGGRVLSGLVRRRQEERDLCIEGLDKAEAG